MKTIIVISIVFFALPVFAFQSGYRKSDGTYVPPTFDDGFQSGYRESDGAYVPPLLDGFRPGYRSGDGTYVPPLFPPEPKRKDHFGDEFGIIPYR